jgi:membrane-associated phospholipid phosphatase
MSWRPVVARSEGLRLLILFVLVILAAWAAGEIVEDWLPGHPLQVADRWTFTTLRGLRTPFVDQVMITLTECGGVLAVWGVALSAGAWLAWRRAWRPLVYGLAAVGGGSLINSAIKLAVHRARPTDLHLAGASAYSFPSGHSTTNAVLYGFLIILVWRQTGLRRLTPVIAACAVFVAAICFSRLYLGAHWLSDVAGGLIFATTWLVLLSKLYDRRPAPDVAPWGLLMVSVIALVIFSGISIFLDHATDLHRYALVRGH